MRWHTERTSPEPGMRPQEQRKHVIAIAGMQGYHTHWRTFSCKNLAIRDHAHGGDAASASLIIFLVQEKAP
jgi:hypothetical protein